MVAASPDLVEADLELAASLASDTTRQRQNYIRVFRRLAHALAPVADEYDLILVTARPALAS